ncbi:hypothetical protein BMF94_1809 [Rhodotorula taiwanensis]|uniref:Cystinosin n=1 Tax=Rhodotorula taiwanensis TaxID=741276 RepID=A0A2S5BEI5_9BASI|nr:hypothetical protein BMF94_1809 [Rhodotorula taiwanensis]
MVVFWAQLSTILGWTYTIIWSLSFYPQIWINYRRKSTTGISMDFLCLNPIGFACLTTYNLALYTSSTVREQYAARHDGHYPQVQPNDLAFAVHALLLSLVILSQTLIYKRGPLHQLSRFHRAVILLILSTISITLLLAWSGWVYWLDFILVLSYLKLYVTAAKMIPQAWYNYQRKSTVGWSIENIFMDLSGGILSLIQLVIDSALDHDWRGITGNPGKLGLSFLALGFDTLFLVQHYVLYRGAVHEDENVTAESSERDRLLAQSDAATAA